MIDRTTDNNDVIQHQLNYIKRKLNERTALSNLSNYANIASQLANGNIKIDIDSVNKIINLGYGTSKVWFNVNARTLNNMTAILFNTSQINGLLSLASFNLIKADSQLIGLYTNYAVSTDVVLAIVNDIQTNYAQKVHQHCTSDIYRLNESLDDILDNKSDINHNHDDKYIQLTSITDTITVAEEEEEEEEEEEKDNMPKLIPSTIAVIQHCKDFLTVPMIQSSQVLQALLKGDTGKSAFEVWVEHQPVRYQQDGVTVIPYTYNEYLNAISGATGATGDTGPAGLSAYEVWCSLQEPLGYDNDGYPLYPSEEAFIASLAGENFIEWYCRVREADINTVTWEDVCTDIVSSVSQGDGSGSLFDIIFGAGESVGLAATVADLKPRVIALEASVTALQSQIYVLQGAVGSILSTTVSDTAIEGFDTIVDDITSTANNLTGGNSTNAFQGIRSMFNDLWTNVINPSTNTLSSITSNVSASVLHAPLVI